MMTPDALCRTWFEQVWNKLDESAIDRLMAPDAMVHGLGPESKRGHSAFKEYFHQLRQALSDIHIDVVRTVVEGDLCAAHCHVTARHSGHTLGGPPTNQRVDFWGMSLTRVKDDKIVEGWNTFDFLTMYQQLGWVPAPVVPA